VSAPGQGLPSEPLGRLVDAVQANCHIADARHAADLPLCIYLLQMREFYRWEHGLPFGAALDRDAVGRWLSQREGLWSELEARPLHRLPLGDRLFDPLDAEALNAELIPSGLVYGAGITGIDRPTFFVAQLHGTQVWEDGLRLQITGRELARSLSAPPAALAQGGTVVLRRESLARWLWEKFEAFSLRRGDGPFMALAQAYALHDSSAFVAALPRMVDEQCEMLLLHELGEHRAGLRLEPAWSAMRLTLTQRRTEMVVRAVRDHIADLEVTLPALLARGADASLHLWFANYDGLRAQLFPALSAAYAAWRRGDAGAALRRAAQAGSVHFRGLAAELLRLHSQFGDLACAPIAELLASPGSICTAGTREASGR
jgi:hypothetical protein